LNSPRSILPDFSFDGQKKTLKQKPYRWLIRPPALTPGKKYIVKARVTALVDKHGKTKRVVKHSRVRYRSAEVVRGVRLKPRLGSR